ncbi:MAG TPA: type II toxin-antitoxin system RelE/ParE family toxin [Holophagaceae bacterium]|nr:type II toxin-antitoxin system RelE/ParE family toxin [Holophagaceae bacterium]
MRLGILWSDKAREGLRESLAFIALDNPGAASGLLDRVLAAVERVARYPHSGRRIPEVPKDPARELVVPPLRIFYERDGSDLVVLAVLRSERDFDPGSLG